MASVALKLSNYGDLDNHAEKLLDELSQKGTRSFPPRVDILRQGGRPGPMHILLDGWAIRYKIMADGRRQILAVLLPGDLFDLNGFMAAHMDHSIASLTGVELATLHDDFLNDVRRDHPDLEKVLWCDLHVIAATQREWIVSLGQRTARERMAHLMCEIFMRLESTKLADGTSCAFPMTQSEMAEALGMTPVYVNRTLQDLRRDGLIHLENKMLTIHDLPELKRQGLFDSGYLRICEDGPQSSQLCETGSAC